MSYDDHNKPTTVDAYEKARVEREKKMDEILSLAKRLEAEHPDRVEVVLRHILEQMDKRKDLALH